MTEEWRPIPGWPGYEVSNLGRVISYRRKTPRILRGDVSPKGYLRVKPYDAATDKQHTLTVHRLVLLAFVGPCPEGQEVRHRDGNPANNRLDNLAYGTRVENMADSLGHGTHISLLPRCPLNHLLAGTNLLRDEDGGRWCRKCTEARAAWEERRAAT